jgi:hypothetical protein
VAPFGWSGRFADHDANMGLLCCTNRAFRRRVYSSLRAGTWHGIRPAKYAVRVDRKEIELRPLSDRARSESDEQ